MKFLYSSVFACAVPLHCHVCAWFPDASQTFQHHHVVSCCLLPTSINITRSICSFWPSWLLQILWLLFVACPQCFWCLMLRLASADETSKSLSLQGCFLLLTSWRCSTCILGLHFVALLVLLFVPWVFNPYRAITSVRLTTVVTELQVLFLPSFLILPQVSKLLMLCLCEQGQKSRS